MKLRTIILALILFFITGSTVMVLPASFHPVSAVIRSFPGDSWAPIGPFIDRIQFQVFADENSEFLALQGGQLDFTDWPLTASFESPPPPQTSLCNDPNMICTDLSSEAGMFQIDFNFLPLTHTTTNWWGVPFLQPELDPNTHSTMVLTASGTEIREAIAHLIDKDPFITNTLLGRGAKIDYPVSAAQEKTIDGTLLSRTGQHLNQLAPVCQFDSLAAHRTCVSAFNLAADPNQTPAVNSADWRAALDHFAQLGWIDSNNDGIIDRATGQYPLPSALAPLEVVVRSDHPPRTTLGTNLVNAVNQMFGAAVAIADYKTISQAGSTVFDTGDNEWHMYTGGYRLDPFWDHIHDIWDSTFASDWCGGPRTGVGSNYNVYCNPTYDALAETFKFSTTVEDATVNTPPVFNEFGRTLPAVPIYSAAARQAYRNGWAGGIQYVGFNVGNDANPYTQLNARRLDNVYPQCSGFGGSKNCLRQGLRQGTNSLSVFFYQTVWESWFVSRVYDTLLQADPFSPTTFYGWMAKGHDDTIRSPNLVQYGLCTTGQDPWTTPCKPAGTQMTARFELHNYLRFHDGNPVTVNDVAFSIIAHRDLASFLFPSVANVIAVSKVTPSIIDIHFNQQSVFFPLNIGRNIPIMPQRYWDGDGNMDTFDVAQSKSGNNFDPVAAGIFIGSGPFVCRNTSTGQIGGGCTTSGTQIVDPGQTVTLDRFDLGPDRAQKYMKSGSTFLEYDWADNDNTFTSPQRVTVFDIKRLSACYGVTPGTIDPANPGCSQLSGPGSAAYADFDGNGRVDAFDAVRWARWFDESWTGVGPGGVPVTWSQFVNQLNFPPGPRGSVSMTFTDSNGDGKVNPAETVRFDGSASTDNLSTITTYNWNFGDGATATGTSPSHIYSARGSYNVRLTIVDGVRLTTYTTITVQVI